ncbi:MAG: crosslink repair DNA glycosylase YcaQ family protein [Casimicrobium sp.]
MQTSSSRASNHVELTLAQARLLQLAAMGLLTPPKARATRQSVLKAIRAMNVLQIDTISVVARSPYFVLWSRLGQFESVWLDELLAAGDLFEYWAHAACFLPMEDYPLYRRQMLHLEAAGSERTALRLAAEPHAHTELIEHVREHGPVRAADFEHEDGRKGNGWWDWKPDKLRLESLFTAGEIMVKRREKFHRVYDLRERVLPPHLLNDDAVPSREQTAEAWTLAAVKAMGLAPARWIGDYFRHAGKAPRPDPEALVERGLLLRISVDDLPWPAYVHPDHTATLVRAQQNKLDATYRTLLSPFDPLVWDRERALTLWNFDYRIECYTPEAKRQYGYFTLPILIRGALVGRLDAKAHRADGVFEVRALHLEPNVKADDALAADIADTLVRCATWHNTPAVSVSQTFPTTFAKRLRAAVKSQPSMLL